MASKPNIKHDRSNTYHRDGTVSHWDVYDQQWRRAEAQFIGDQVLATMTQTERTRIANHAPH